MKSINRVHRLARARRSAYSELPLREHTLTGKTQLVYLSILLTLLLTIPTIAQTSPPRFREVMEIKLRPIQSITWHPGGEILAAAGEHGVWLYDADTLTTIAHLDLRVLTEQRLMYHEPIQWSPDGQWMVAHFDDGARVWEYEDGTFTRILEDITIKNIQWSPDGAQYLIVNDEGVHVFAGITRELMRSYSNVALQWSPNNGYIAAIGDSSITLIDSMTFDTMRVLRADEEGTDRFARWSPNSRKIAATINDRVFVWDVRSGNLLFTWERESEEYDDTGRNPVNDIWWSPDSAILYLQTVTTQYVRTPTAVIALDPTTGVVVNNAVSSSLGLIATGLSPDGLRTVASSGMYQGFTRVWVEDVNSEASVETDHLGRYPLFSPDGTLFVGYVGYPYRETIQLYDNHSFEVVSNLDTGTPYVKQVAWSPDGQKLAVLSFSELQIWDVLSGTMSADDQALGDMRFLDRSVWSKDGRIFVASSSSGITVFELTALHLQDTQTQQQVSTIYTPNHWSDDAQWFQGSGAYIVTVEDGMERQMTTRLWNALTGEEVFSLQTTYDTLAQSLDGRYLATVTNMQNGAAGISVWDMALNDLVVGFEHPLPVETVLWHPENSLLLLSPTVNDGLAHRYLLDFYDATTGQSLHSMPIDGGALSLSADGTFLAQEHDGSVVVYSLVRMGDTVTTDVVQTFTFPGVTFRDVRWHRSESTFAAVGTVSADNSSYLYIWDLTQAPYNVLTADLPSDLLDYAWRDDGQLVLASGQNDAIQLWEEIP